MLKINEYWFAVLIFEYRVETWRVVGRDDIAWRMWERGIINVSQTHFKII